MILRLGLALGMGRSVLAGNPSLEGWIAAATAFAAMLAGSIIAPSETDYVALWLARACLDPGCQLESKQEIQLNEPHQLKPRPAENSTPSNFVLRMDRSCWISSCWQRRTSGSICRHGVKG